MFAEQEAQDRGQSHQGREEVGGGGREMEREGGRREREGDGERGREEGEGERGRRT